MRVRLTQIDGAMPNIALMRLAAWHRHCGDEVYFTRKAYRETIEPDFDLVYGSAIFKFSDRKIDEFRRNFPNAFLGGTGVDTGEVVENHVPDDWQALDYGIYPDYPHSIGFSQRGCRLKCGFCVVPKKEGRNVPAATIEAIWRGDPHPKNIVLLDNDFFGQSGWQDKAAEIVDGGYKVSLIQGINVRLISEEGAGWLARMKYYDGKFGKRRIYTAWDNVGDEKVFFRGVNRMLAAGVKPHHIMAYMLIGYAPDETLEQIEYRFWKMVRAGIMPYPMVYDRSVKQLCDFQRWAIRRYYQSIPFGEYRSSIIRRAAEPDARQISLPVV